jgi:hypothetical protein
MATVAHNMGLRLSQGPACRERVRIIHAQGPLKPLSYATLRDDDAQWASYTKLSMSVLRRLVGAPQEAAQSSAVTRLH